MSAMTIAISLVASDMTAAGFGSLTGNIGGLSGMLRMLAMSGSKVTPQMVGMGIAAGVTGAAFAAMVGVIKDGVTQAGDLEMAITRLQLASQLGADAFDNLKLAVIDLATHSLYSTTEAAAAFEKLSEMGFTASQTMYGMGAAEDAVTSKSYDASAALQGVGRQGMAVGEAMRTDAVTGVTLLGSALHVFAGEGMTAKQAADLLVGAFYNGVPSADDLQMAINNAGAMASAAGIKFQDFVSTLGLLAQAGMPASQAGTSLRYMIQSLIAPTGKQAKAMADLGIETVHATPYLDSLVGVMDRQDKATRKAAQAYDGSVAGLQALFKAAQKAGDIPLDTTFNQWAMANGLLNSKLFDSQGQFMGLKNAVDVLDQAMAAKGLSMQQKMDIITQLFNVRSGRAAQILTNLQQFDAAYKNEWDRIGKADALANAQKVLGTFQGSVQELKTSISSALAVAFMPLIQAVTPLIQKFNDLVGWFIRLDPKVQGTAAGILVLVTALLGVATAVLTVMTVGALLSALGVAIGTILGTVGTVLGIVAGVIAGVVILFLAFKGALESNHALLQFFQGAIQTLGQWMGALWGQLQNLWKTLQQLAPLWEVLKVVLAVIAVIVAVVLLAAIFLIVGAFIALVFVINLVIQVIIVIVSWVIKLGESFVQWVVGMWTAAVEKFNQIRDLIHNVFTFIGNLFPWLYNHNYYIKALVDTIVQKFNEAKTFITAVLTVIRVIFTEAWHNIVTTVQTAISNFLKAIDNATRPARDAIGRVLDAIKSAITNIFGQAHQWGANLLQMFIDGITSKLGALGSTLGNIAGKIASVLGFHSPPKEGPLADSDEYMPNMMKMYASGIRAHMGLVHSALTDVGSMVTTTLNPSLNVNTATTAAVAAQSAFIASQQSSGTVVIPINVDGKQIAQYTLDLQTRQLKQTGMTRYGR